MIGSKRRGSEHAILKCHILPGQFRGKAQPAHCQFMTNQLAALNNGTQKPFAGQCSPLLNTYNTSFVSLCSSCLSPALHVRYVPDGELSAVQRHTCLQLHDTEHKQRHKPLCSISVTGNMPCLVARSCLRSPAHLLCFALGKKSAWTDTELSCLAEVTWKPFPFSLSRSDLFYPSYAPLQNGKIDSACY